MNIFTFSALHYALVSSALVSIVSGSEQKKLVV
jgi:hypothetical protein